MKYFEIYESKRADLYLQKILQKDPRNKMYKLDYIDENKVIWKSIYCVGDKFPNRIKELIKHGFAKVTDVTIIKNKLCSKCKEMYLQDNTCPFCGVIND